MDRTINATDHRKDFVDGNNEIDKRYLKENGTYW